MLEESECIVYVLTNDAMPGFIKVGKTTQPVQERLKQLYTLGVPVPFECYYAGIVPSNKNVERRIHRAFDAFRGNKNREFFEMEAEAAADIIRLVERQEVTPGEGYIESPDDKKAMDRLEKRAERFSFKMVGIAPGTVLTFKLNDTITCKALDNRNVEFRGETTSLSAAALSALKAQGFEWKSAQGALYWMHNGQNLVDLRKALEEE